MKKTDFKQMAQAYGTIIEYHDDYKKCDYGSIGLGHLFEKDRF